MATVVPAVLVVLVVPVVLVERESAMRRPQVMVVPVAMAGTADEVAPAVARPQV